MSKYFILWTLLFSLLSVLAANGLSFHAENEAASHLCIMMDQGHEAEHMDPCTSGFCHFGHCATFTMASLVELTTPYSESLEYPQVEHSLLDRSLEEPFQPPRA